MKPPAAMPPPPLAPPVMGGAGAGPASARRLTNQEYVYTVLDVLGVNIAARVRELPADRPSEGFRNAAEGLQASPLRTSGYATLAVEIARQVPAATLSSCTMPSNPCVRDLVTAHARRLFRRPPVADQIDRYVALFNVVQAEAGSFDTSARAVIEAMLQAPAFLFRLERSADRPDAYDIASRLSYLLWASAPDAALLDDAAAGRLTDAATLPVAVERMLADARARRGLELYVEDWLGLYALDRLERSPARYPMFSASLTAEMKAETLSFFSRLVLTDRADFMNAFTDKRTFLTVRLAQLYGVDQKKDGNHTFTEQQPRIGFLTHAATLSAPAVTDDASIVDRGVWMLRTLLCQEAPEPPPDVATDLRGVPENLPERQRFALHSTNPVCAACHRVFDPLGLAFEPFDALGRYRTTDERGHTLRSDGALMLDSRMRSFTGAADLAKMLRESASIERCLVTKVVAYALGRHLGESDAGAIDRIQAGWKADGRDWRRLLGRLASDALIARLPPKEVLP